MFSKKTINDYDLSGKKVLLRADYNVPIDENGKISSDYRIQQSLPTVKALIERGCRVVICSHLGRPKSKDDKSCTLKPVAKRLGELLDKKVSFASDCIGDEVSLLSRKLESGEVLLLENLRYHEAEENNDEAFAKQIVESVGAEVFVQDGFGVVHRAHASTDAITRLLPSVAGLLLEKEVDTITKVMSEPERPLMAVVGGAKIADKIDVLNKFIEIADIVVIGGAMANTFLLAQGVEVGESLVDKNDLDIAKEVMHKARQVAKDRNFIFYIPQDGVVADKIATNAKTRVVDWDTHVFADVEQYPARPKKSDIQVGKNEKILDIGPFSGAFIAGATQMVKTVVWNGTMGVSETKGLHGPVGPFAHGTELVIEALLGQFGNRPFTVIGGGDTSSYLEARKMTDMFNHVSTGGGASLELMIGKSLPGVESLMNRE